MGIVPVLVEEQEKLAKAIELNELVTDSIELLLDYRHVSSAREDIEMLRVFYLDIDDNNEPVLENIPEP